MNAEHLIYFWYDKEKETFGSQSFYNQEIGTAQILKQLVDFTRQTMD